MLPVCPSCGADAPEPLVRMDTVPIIVNQLWATAEEAQSAPVGDIDLVACKTCALVWNRAFDPEKVEYAPGYENALHFSKEFRAFADDLAADLVSRHGLKGSHVVEVGAGDGFFLERLVDAGVASAAGYDPSLPPEKEGGDGPVRMVRAFFDPDQFSDPFGAIICRHVVEHLSDPKGVVCEMRRALPNDTTPVYVEVPNAGWMMRANSIWDVIYEHATYWTKASMRHLFESCGFVGVSSRALYGDQFLATEGTAGGTATAPGQTVDEVLEIARGFAAASNSLIDDWRGTLSHRNARVAIWGSGSKGSTFANLIHTGGITPAGMVDQNHRKHGKFIPGAGVPVVAPADLPGLAPDVVVISNGIYRDEITAQIDDLGLSPDVMVLAE